MIRVLCPHCKRRYRTVTEVMGREAICHNCHITFVIGQERPPFQWKQTDLAEDSWIGYVPPEKREELKHCIMCEAPMEPNAIRCPACGANQITGVVHRGRRTAADESDGRPNILQWIPWRYCLIVAGVALIAYTVYWAITAVHRSAATVGDDLGDQALVNKAARFLRETGDEIDFAREFAGQVTDDNLPRLMPRVSARDPIIRRAAIQLVGNGKLTNIEPIVAAAEAGDAASPAREVLQVIGSRQLVELSCSPDESVRQSAAAALIILFNLPGDEAVRQQLAAAGSVVEKTDVLNRLCRHWPEAVGIFSATANGQDSPAAILVEQIGRTFYMRIGDTEFRSIPNAERRFEIPIEHWCAATGQAVDVAGLRRLIGGMVTLESPSGAGWFGMIRLTVKQPLAANLPGFIPFPPPDRGQTSEVPIQLRRKGR